MELKKYNLVEDYLKHLENFNVTGSINTPVYIKQFSDEQLKSEYNIISLTDKLHWKEEWMFIFNHAICERRKIKIEKIKQRWE